MKRLRGAPQRREATVRTGGVQAVVDVLRTLGVDPFEVLNEAGIDPRLLDDADNVIPYRARGRLLARGVARSGCQHLGLLVGQSMNLPSLGLVGLLMRSSPDVGTALRSLTRSLHVHSKGAAMELTVDGVLATLSYETLEPSAEGTAQTGDGAVAMMLNVMRSLCGDGFRPVEARFAHRRPRDVQPFRRYFHIPLRFDADEYALVFSQDWLEARVPGGDAQLRHLLQKHIDALEARHGDDFPAQVRSVLRSGLLTGHGSVDQVAELFSMHSRTLSRRLEAFGIGFQQLVDEGRFEIARQLLDDTSLQIDQIAASLGYARASTFTRAFHRWSGTTPSLWRARDVDAAPAGGRLDFSDRN